MRIKVISTKLAKALKQLKAVIGDNDDVWRDRVFITAQPDRKSIDLTGVGGGASVAININAEIDVDFDTSESIALCASRLMAGVDNYDGVVNLDVFSRYVDVNGENFSLHLTRYPSESFVGLRLFGGGKFAVENADVECMLPARALIEMLRKVAYAVDATGIRESIRCVNLNARSQDVETKSCILRAEATDAKRLSICEYEVFLESKTGKVEDLAIQLSRRVVGVARSLVGSDDGEVCLARKGSRGYICETNGKWMISFALPAAAYPSIDRLIPDRSDVFDVYSFDREQMMTAIKIAGSFDAELEETRGVKLEFANASARVSIIEDEIVVAVSDFAVEAVKKSEGRVVVNCRAKFLLDILKTHDDDKMSFEYYGDGKPVALRSSIPALALIMPMRVNESEVK